MKKLKVLLAFLTIFTLVLAGCGKQEEKTASASKEKKEVKVGTSPGPYSELFLNGVKPILEKKGYKIKAVEFNDLQQADVALADGGVDLNVDQHTAYMENFNANSKSNLVSITPIPTVPAGIFPGKKKSLKDIKSGDTIAVPNDASNAARAYALLQKAKLIKLKDGVELAKATAADIGDNPLNLKIVEMDSAQIPRTLQDVDYGVIPGSIVYASKTDPDSKLLSEDILPHLVLVAVVDKANKDSQWAKDVAAAYQSDEFKDYMKEHNKNDYWFIPDELK
ncbi:MetQ/NlpA family ABC transporter substrate-binding protein [Neobacillus dielmonensis]|uniref:MetQ/NlpA family ABC transporter substrate-binding protein n=1 Tax=Neobacillus dielmonensis TaxID=1347369 RepID=UPI0005A800F6|nr:MetQ/NlpA family ABC transporter substrate-binding protein [Neobacillus dielmonensis]